MDGGIGSCDKQVAQGSRWEAQVGEHGYSSVGLKQDVSDAEERQFSSFALEPWELVKG